MDTTWVQLRLETFIGACQEYHRLSQAIAPGSYWDEATMRPAKNAIEEQLPAVRRIIESLDPKLLDDEFGRDDLYSGMSASESTARMALGLLWDREELERRLRPDGPVAVADQFHPWAWGAAAQFWNAGQLGPAVEYAAKSVTANLQAKSGLSISDRELATEVFSPKPSTKTVRLWFGGSRSTNTWRSRQEGLHHLAIGAFAGIRNLVTHAVEVGWSEQEAIEYLAVLSTVARWAEETVVVDVPDQVGG